MENIIDITYFRGGRNIPNLSKDTTAFENTYIAVYQKQYLINVLGYALYNEFEAGLNVLPIEDIEQQWLDLRDGKEYYVTVDGVETLTKWNGLANTEKISPITDYVYHEWLKINFVQLTGTGVGSSDSENSTRVSPAFKSKESWNDCINLTGDLKKYLSKIDYYNLDRKKNGKYLSDDIEIIDDNYKLDESLFMFLYHNRDVYTDWIFTNNTTVNVLGI